MASPARTILLTGACSGLGRRLAPLLAEKGHSLALHGTDKAVVQQVVDECIQLHPQPFTIRNQVKVFGVTGDLSTPVAAHTALASTAWRFGRLDVMINHVIPPESRFSHVCDVERTLDFMNAAQKRAFYSALAARSHLVKSKGTLINIITEDADMEAGGTCSLSADLIQTTMSHLTKLAAKDYADAGVRVNAIRYGDIDAQGKADVRDIENMLLFLMSDRASGTHGLDIRVPSSNAAYLSMQTATDVTIGDVKDRLQPKAGYPGFYADL